MAVLIAKYLHYDFGAPEDPRNDHLIFCKGHASPLLYAIYKAAGAISDDEMLTFRKFGSRIEGHPTPVLPWVDVATGSLGQGLPDRRWRRARRQATRPPPVPGLVPLRRLRDGRGLDVGGLRAARLPRPGQPDRDHRRQPARPDRRDDARLGPGRLRSRGRRPSAGTPSRSTGTTSPRSTGAYAEAIATTGRPTVIVARTEKGHGVEAVANKQRHARQAARRSRRRRSRSWAGSATSAWRCRSRRAGRAARFPTRAADACRRYEPGTKEATRKAYGDALVALGKARGDVVASTARSATRTYSEEFAQAHPGALHPAYIAEQQMVADAVGFQVRGWRPSPPPSRPSSAAPTTSSAWPRSAARTSSWPARTPA